jgi:hypothetical protein
MKQVSAKPAFGRKGLALVLSLVLLVGVLAFPAGAAFSDSDQITHTQAAEECADRGILGGYPDGSYRPSQSVTRAELCKMIAVALNGGKEPELSEGTDVSFPDTASSWAKGYIAYCAQRSIVAGMEDGTFRPNDTVTGTQAAKMLLVALGYDPASQGFTGTTWAMHTQEEAQTAGLYTDLDLDGSAPLSRDDAAQMIWNALNATLVTYVSSPVEENGETVGTSVTRQDRTTQDGQPLTLLIEAYGEG